MADWAPHPVEGDKLLFVVDGGILTDAGLRPVPDGVEIAQARFWPPQAFALLAPARLARRLHLAVTAAATGQCVYAENGTIP